MNMDFLVKPALKELAETLALLSARQYAAPCIYLNDATVGQHVRHIIELYNCVTEGYSTGIVNYDNRKRDKKIETEKEIAIMLLHGIIKNVKTDNRELILEYAAGQKIFSVPTNYYREIMYNAEHTVHHMALIRVGIQCASNIVLPVNFGVAASTVKYREACVQ